MPGPTTEVLNEDLKEVKVDIRDVRSDLGVLKADLHQVALGVAEFRAEVRVTIGVAKWAGALLVTTVIAGTSTTIWWASGLTSQVRTLESRFDKLESRFDKLETSIIKALEQGRPSLSGPTVQNKTIPPGK